MAYTMFNQQPCKIHSSERHNSRTQELDYIFPELSHNNESFYFDNRGLVEIYNECKQLYEEKVKRKFQEKTAPIREGVVLIDEYTTLDDVKMLAEELGELLHWKPLQVHIHRDEGHQLSPDNKGGKNVAKLNLHAHIVFDTQNKMTGKMNNSGKENLSTAQDICARVLRMERGKPSTKKHLDALNFKIKKQEEQLQGLLLDIENLISKNEKLRQENEYMKKNEEILLKEKYELENEIEKLKIAKELSSNKIEEEIKKFIDKKEELQKEWNYLIGKGEMEDLAERFIQIANDNPEYNVMPYNDVLDELWKMIQKELIQQRKL